MSVSVLNSMCTLEFVQYTWNSPNILTVNQVEHPETYAACVDVYQHFQAKRAQ